MTSVQFEEKNKNVENSNNKKILNKQETLVNLYIKNDKEKLFAKDFWTEIHQGNIKENIQILKEKIAQCEESNLKLEDLADLFGSIINISSKSAQTVKESITLQQQKELYKEVCANLDLINKLIHSFNADLENCVTGLKLGKDSFKENIELKTQYQERVEDLNEKYQLYREKGDLIIQEIKDKIVDVPTHLIEKADEKIKDSLQFLSERYNHFTYHPEKLEKSIEDHKTSVNYHNDIIKSIKEKLIIGETRKKTMDTYLKTLGIIKEEEKEEIKEDIKKNEVKEDRKRIGEKKKSNFSLFGKKN